MEAAQIARTIARALHLNEDLAEAVALGHDLGHTPFGHAGEDVLNRLHPGGFRHNEQSLRVVDVLEKPGGLNLTFEVRDGILNHMANGKPATLETRVAHFSDRIAYVNHDIEDAIRGDVLSPADLPKGPVSLLGKTRSERISTLVTDLIENSQDQPKVAMSEAVQTALDELRDFLFDRLYIDSGAKREEEKAKGVVEALYTHYVEDASSWPGSEGATAVLDYVAGMTDRFAIREYRRLFVPSTWRPDD